VNAEGWLTGIEEKPDPRDLADCGPGALISMNVWRFDHRIFDACRDVQRSERGEYELPEAVGLAVSRGVLFRALRARGAGLDLSRRGDVARVSAQLHDLEPRL
jgi:glucose-1-phosphate thymidylyltransferase